MFSVALHQKKACLLQPFVVTHDKEMHNYIILVVNRMVVVIHCGKTAAKNLPLKIKMSYLCMLLRQVATSKLQGMVAMDKFSSGAPRVDICNILWSPNLRIFCQRMERKRGHWVFPSYFPPQNPPQHIGFSSCHA